MLSLQAEWLRPFDDEWKSLFLSLRSGDRTFILSMVVRCLVLNMRSVILLSLKLLKSQKTHFLNLWNFVEIVVIITRIFIISVVNKFTKNFYFKNHSIRLNTAAKCFTFLRNCYFPEFFGSTNPILSSVYTYITSQSIQNRIWTGVCEWIIYKQIK